MVQGENWKVGAMPPKRKTAEKPKEKSAVKGAKPAKRKTVPVKDGHNLRPNPKKKVVNDDAPKPPQKGKDSGKARVKPAKAKDTVMPDLDVVDLNPDESEDEFPSEEDLGSSDENFSSNATVSNPNDDEQEGSEKAGSKNNQPGSAELQGQIDQHVGRAMEKYFRKSKKRSKKKCCRRERTPSSASSSESESSSEGSSVYSSSSENSSVEGESANESPM